MTPMTTGDAIFAIVGGAVMVAGAIFPMGFNNVIRHGTGDEPLPPATTLPMWKAEAKQHVRQSMPHVIIGDLFRGWEGPGTTFLRLFGALCQMCWILTGAFLFAWGVAWGLL